MGIGVFHFDGSGDYLQSDLPSLGNEWTVQFWVSRYGSGTNWTFTIGDVILLMVLSCIGVIVVIIYMFMAQTKYS